MPQIAEEGRGGVKKALPVPSPLVREVCQVMMRYAIALHAILIMLLADVAQQGRAGVCFAS